VQSLTFATAARLESPVTPKMIAQLSRPLTDAGWQHTAPGRYFHWRTPTGDVGIAFDIFAAPRIDTTLTAWILWAVYGRPPVGIRDVGFLDQATAGGTVASTARLAATGWARVVSLALRYFAGWQYRTASGRAPR
jgi:hypothetical protein